MLILLCHFNQQTKTAQFQAVPLGRLACLSFRYFNDTLKTTMTKRIDLEELVNFPDSCLFI